MTGTSYSILDLSTIPGCMQWKPLPDGAEEIREVAFDSRQIPDPAHSIFVVLPGPYRHGRAFIPDACAKGVRMFLLGPEDFVPEDCGWIRADDPLRFLQDWAATHREKFSIPIVGITGSNGKTIVKEWMATLLESFTPVIKSPRSYNSQMGVAISLLQFNSEHKLAILEAGISRKGEMQRLAELIQPDLGIMTHFGDAHSEGFTSSSEKLQEKIRLFATCKKVISGSGQQEVVKALVEAGKKVLTIGTDSGADVKVDAKDSDGWEVSLSYSGKPYSFKIPVRGKAALENGLLAWLGAVECGMPAEQVSERMNLIQPVSMRMELIADNPEVTVLNDAYNADLESIGNAFQLLKLDRSQPEKAVILTDLEHQGIFLEDSLKKVMRDAVKEFGESNVFLIGANFFRLAKGTGIQTWENTDAFLEEFDYDNFRQHTVLLKGARKFHLEELIPWLTRRIHQTYLKINLNSLSHNVRTLRNFTGTNVRLMAMVKAFSYGSGTWEIAQSLEKEGVDYFAVAYISEGIELRSRGIRRPIMVMNPDAGGIAQLAEFDLEPEVFSLGFLKKLISFARKNEKSAVPIHLKLDTGMHRLGFLKHELEELCEFLKENSVLKIQSVFTHLAASEDHSMDHLTHAQVTDFLWGWEMICKATQTKPERHILNSAGIFRFPEYHFEMVRPGLGLYGIDPLPNGKSKLKEVGTLYSHISLIRSYPEGTGISYGHSSVTKRASRIATIPVGYADGIPRKLGNGKIAFHVNGKPAPTIGRICMDMLMVDVTDNPEAKEGDEVVLFGENGCSVIELARAAETIPYEILAGISQRVRRVFVRD